MKICGMLFSISARAMFCRQSENGECQVCLILKYRRLHDKIARLVSGGAEEAGMKGWRGRAADVFTEPGEIAANMKSVPGSGTSDLPPGQKPILS